MKNMDPTQRRTGANILKFLALMLVFTLIARGASGATLARVSLTSPARGDIVDFIRSSATVAATDFIEITAPDGLSIKEIIATVGRNVEPGEPIAAFYLHELEEKLIRETASLNNMRHDLDRLLRGETIDPSTLESSQRSLRRAQEDYNITVTQGEEDIANATFELEQLLNELEEEGAKLQTSIIRNHQRILEDYYAILAQNQAEIDTAQRDLNELLSQTADAIDDTALQNALRAYQRAREDFEAATARDQADITAAQEYLEELRSLTGSVPAIDNARRTLDRIREDYNTARQTNQNNVDTARNAIYTAWNALSIAQGTGDYAAIADALAEIERTEAAFTAAENAMEVNMRTVSRALEDAQHSYNQARQTHATTTQTDIERAETALEDAISRAENNQHAAARNFEDLQGNITQAQRNLDNAAQNQSEQLQNQIDAARNALETANSRAEERHFAITRQLEDATYALYAEFERANNAAEQATRAANSDIERAQREVQNAITRAETNRRTASRQIEDLVASLRAAERNHQNNIQQNVDTTVLNAIIASTLELDIADQETAIETLHQLIYNGGVLYAQTAGLVYRIQTSGITGSSTPIATLQDTAGGFNATITISAREAERLTIGGETTVTTGAGNMFFTPTTTAFVSAISQPCENDTVTVTLTLPRGDWTINQRIDAEVLLSRANYDFALPISALRSDDRGYFLYVVEHQSTVLGVQNVAMRVNVNIIAQDNNMVSVSGAIGRSCQVIAGSDRPVSEGARVRVEP